MTTQQVADRFDELSKEGKFKLIQEELYADDAVSIEPAHSQGMQTVEGLEAIKQKGDHFQAMVEEIHGAYSKDFVVAGNHFCVAMGMDITMKGMRRSQMDEIAVYEVNDGKIVKEQFFY